MITEKERERLQELSMALSDWEALRQMFIDKNVIKLARNSKEKRKRWTFKSPVTGRNLSVTERQLIKIWDKRKREKHKDWMAESR